MPAQPVTPSPSSELQSLKREVAAHPSVAQAGLTTTDDGHWALLVRVRPGVSTPVADIEQMRGNQHVVYEEARKTPPVARPAFPAKGE
jgi:hypothetical protein